MSRYHVRFKDGSSLEISADEFGRYDNGTVGFYVSERRTEYSARLFGPPKSASRTVRAWTMLVPTTEILFICPARALAPASGMEAGTVETEGLDAKHDSPVAESETPK